MIPAELWNALIERIAYARPLTCYAEAPTRQRHAWQISPAWSAERERWECQVEPGYVNGDDVEVSVAAKDAPERTRERLEGSTATTLRAWLAESPRIALGSMRAIGRGSPATGVTETDAGGFVTVHEAVPLFFRALGVGEAAPVEVPPEGASGELPGAPPEDAPSRLLRACDVVLRKPRAGSRSQWTDSGEGWQVEFVATFTEQLRERAFIFTTARYEAPAEVAAFARLLGESADAPFDEIQLGTVYLLSPTGVDPEAVPDETWTPYAQNFVFYNLAHRVKAFDVLKPQSLRFPLFLAGGVAQPTADEILAMFNTSQNQLAALLSATEAGGQFWTCG